jgi:hypothetical protein
MAKKKRDQVFNRKFNSGDVASWQEMADKDPVIRGNLTTWVEIQLNNVVKQRKKLS